MFDQVVQKKVLVKDNCVTNRKKVCKNWSSTKMGHPVYVVVTRQWSQLHA
jgi:hypothetical protein